MEYPKVSILTPSYNRRKFVPLITYNLLNMDYDKLSRFNKYLVRIKDKTFEVFYKKNKLHYLKNLP